MELAPAQFFAFHFQTMWIVVRAPSLKSFANQKTCQITEWSYCKTLCRSHVICKGFFSMTTLSFDEIFRIFWFLKRQILFIIKVGNYKLCNLWIRYMGMAFRDGDNFCKAFTEALMHDMSYHSWLRYLWYDLHALVPLQKLCKNCPHPEKLQFDELDF